MRKKNSNSPPIGTASNHEASVKLNQQATTWGWHWVSKAVGLLSFVAAGGAYARGVPIVGALLILVLGVAAAAMAGAADRFSANHGALRVLQWAVVAVVLAVCLGVIVEILRPCTLPGVGKAIGSDCGANNSVRKEIYELRGDADRADAAYRSRSVGPENAAVARNLVLGSCNRFWSVDRTSLPNADLLAEVHMNIARMCSKAAVVLMEARNNDGAVMALSTRASRHAKSLTEVFNRIEARGKPKDKEFLSRSTRNRASAFYYLALANRVMQCASNDAGSRTRFRDAARAAWRDFIQRSPGMPADDQPLISLLSPPEDDVCAP